MECAILFKTLRHLKKKFIKKITFNSYMTCFYVQNCQLSKIKHFWEKNYLSLQLQLFIF